MSDLYTIGETCFDEFVGKITSYGLDIDPNLELRRGTGMWCYYNLDDGHIYLSLPDLNEPAGKLHSIFLRSLLSCDSEEEFLVLMEFLIPFFISHEMGHHLRHRYNQFGDNMWEEEQIANQLAIALNKSRLSMDERTEVERLLKKSITGLAKKIEYTDAGVDSYRDLYQALHISGSLSDTTFRQLKQINKLFEVKPEEVLLNSDQQYDNLMSHMNHRDYIIGQINTEYAQDMMRYLYYHMSWLHLEITNHECQYVSAFARQHLDVQPLLLTMISKASEATTEAIIACFKAFQDTTNISEAGGEFFYRRYRSLLLTQIGLKSSDFSANTERLRQEADFILHSYESRDTDMIIYLANLAPESLRNLFPQHIKRHPAITGSTAQSLPTETDRRLWEHITGNRSKQGTTDDAAANTLEILEILFNIDAFKTLPAEVWLELTHTFCTVKLEKGESIIWKGDSNYDVYVLIDGELSIVISKDKQEHNLKYLQPGELVGEMAFFTHDIRQATVKATKPSECLVLRDTDFHIFSFKHPDVLITLGRVLARRLADMNAAYERLSSG